MTSIAKGADGAAARLEHVCIEGLEHRAVLCVRMHRGPPFLVLLGMAGLAGAGGEKDGLMIGLGFFRDRLEASPPRGGSATTENKHDSQQQYGDRRRGHANGPPPTYDLHVETALVVTNFFIHIAESEQECR